MYHLGTIEHLVVQECKDSLAFSSQVVTVLYSSIFTPFWSKSFCSKLGQHLWHIFFNFSTTHDQIVVRTYQCRWDDLRLQNPAWCLIGGPVGTHGATAKRRSAKSERKPRQLRTQICLIPWYSLIFHVSFQRCNFSSIVSCLVSQEVPS